MVHSVRHAPTIAAALALALLTSSNASTASMGEAAPVEPIQSDRQWPSAAEVASASSAPPRMQWVYPHFRWWEYSSATLITAGNLYMNFAGVEYRSDQWQRPLPLDREVRKTLRAEGADRRARLDRISDYFWHTTQYFSVVESLVIPIATDDLNTEAAAQMTLINWQALGTAGLVTRLAHWGFGRTRPALEGCSDEPGSDRPCSLGLGSSFFSGHAAMAAAGAGLNCAHHLALPFYGRGWPNMVPCGVLTASSVTVGVLRIAADKHWFSDVLMGHFLGFSIGFGMPWALHYQFEKSADLLGANVAVLPWAGENEVGVGIGGVL